MDDDDYDDDDDDDDDDDVGTFTLCGVCDAAQDNKQDC